MSKYGRIVSVFAHFLLICNGMLFQSASKILLINSLLNKTNASVGV